MYSSFAAISVAESCRKSLAICRRSASDLREEVALPLGRAQLRAQRHVARVVGAEQVAVREQHRLAEERDALVVAEQAACPSPRRTAGPAGSRGCRA